MHNSKSVHETTFKAFSQMEIIDSVSDNIRITTAYFHSNTLCCIKTLLFAIEPRKNVFIYNGFS